MSRRGNCYDNVVVESFFRTLKADLTDRLRMPEIAVAHAISEYIERFYNGRRLHSTLGYRCPAEFERKHRPAARFTQSGPWKRIKTIL